MVAQLKINSNATNQETSPEAPFSKGCSISEYGSGNLAGDKPDFTNKFWPDLPLSHQYPQWSQCGATMCGPDEICPAILFLLYSIIYTLRVLAQVAMIL